MTPLPHELADHEFAVVLEAVAHRLEPPFEELLTFADPLPRAPERLHGCGREEHQAYQRRQRDGNSQARGQAAGHEPGPQKEQRLHAEGHQQALRRRHRSEDARRAQGRDALVRRLVEVLPRQRLSEEAVVLRRHRLPGLATRPHLQGRPGLTLELLPRLVEAIARRDQGLSRGFQAFAFPATLRFEAIPEGIA